MRKRVSCLAFGVGLVAGTLNAQGQTHGPTFVAQAPVAVPPSGVLVDSAARPGRRTAIGRSGDAAHGQAAYRRHRPDQESANGGGC